MDSATKVFRGTIDFKKGCKKSIGDENEFCVLLSDNTVSRSLPMLLCSEEDIIGTHSSASGYVSDKSLFYIMSRGISRKKAYKLLLSGFLLNTDSIDKEKISEFVDEINKL